MPWASAASTQAFCHPAKGGNILLSFSVPILCHAQFDLLAETYRTGPIPRGPLKQTEQTSTKGISTVRVNSQLCMEIICLALRRMLVMNGSIGVWRCTGAIHISHDVIIRHCSKLLLTRMNEDWSNISCYVLYVTIQVFPGITKSKEWSAGKKAIETFVSVFFGDLLVHSKTYHAMLL